MWNRKLKQANKSLQGSHTREMEDSSADLISELPDALLLHIFSFLDEMAVIQSSVLSRRWRYLWTLIPFPEHVKQKRSYFKKQKIEIREEKLRLEEVAWKYVSRVVIDVAKSIREYFLRSLLMMTMSELQIGVVIHLFITLVYMEYIYSTFDSYSIMEWSDKELERLQVRDSRLTSAANSYSTNKPIMELLFPDNYQPRYKKTAKLYSLFGMLLVMIISCSIVVLRWNLEFILGTGESGRIRIHYLRLFSFLMYFGYLLYTSIRRLWWRQ